MARSGKKKGALLCAPRKATEEKLQVLGEEERSPFLCVGGGEGPPAHNL